MVFFTINLTTVSLRIARAKYPTLIEGTWQLMTSIVLIYG